MQTAQMIFASSKNTNCFDAEIRRNYWDKCIAQLTEAEEYND